MDSTTATITAAALDPALRFLLAHPQLPTPRGLDIGYVLDGLSVNGFLDTAEQAQAWATAIGEEVRRTEYQGSVHHSAVSFTPFYVSVTAIVPMDAEVSA